MNYPRDMIEKYAKPVPRYTSYPTAPHFTETVQDKTVRKWMQAIESDEAISIYLHIPFCNRLCWFCGCHTKHTRKYAPIQSYLQDLYAEIALAAKIIGRRQKIAYLHLGGGSPSLLKEDDLIELKTVLNDAFEFSPDTEISIEFDPTDLDARSLKAFVDFGLTRASLGVQDFDPLVQETINRIQSYEQTKFVIDTLRDYGVTSLNIDALYGLPYQTLVTLEDTLEKVVALNPDRIALFGYAHVPWVKTHQKLIPHDSLPNNLDRFLQARFAENYLVKSEYSAIGIDHFAKSTDSLTHAYETGKARRNFQGYTADNCQTLLGFGVSSISQFKQGYAQNTKSTHAYRTALSTQVLPTERGVALTDNDLIAAAAIEELMCYFTLTPRKLYQRFGAAADIVLRRAHQLASDDKDGFFVQTEDGFGITKVGKPFTRSFAAAFDSYLTSNQAKYSIAV